MYQPLFETFNAQARTANLIPVYREIVADLDTPLTIFAKVAATDSHAFLLESLEGGEKWGRYSFIGLDPILTLESRGDHTRVSQKDKDEELMGDPLSLLKNLLSSFRTSPDGELPRFFGGAVGFMGYDLVRFLERLPDFHPLSTQFPDSSFMIPRLVLIYDNLSEKGKSVYRFFTKPAGPSLTIRSDDLLVISVQP